MPQAMLHAEVRMSPVFDSCAKMMINAADEARPFVGCDDDEPHEAKGPALYRQGCVCEGPWLGPPGRLDLGQPEICVITVHILDITVGPAQRYPKYGSAEAGRAGAV